MDLEKYLLNEYHRPDVCVNCGGNMVFRGVGEYQCERCQHVMYDDYGKARNYLEKHGGATVAEVAGATGVSQQTINQMLREERFEVSVDSKSFIKCEGCGRPIRMGRYCAECAKLVAAAEAKKRTEKDAELRKEMIRGVGTVGETAEGERRFKRGDK